jgi:putative addiction module killer protein
MNVESTPEFNDWLSLLDEFTRSRVQDRLDRIREHSHFGDKKYLGGHLFELRWRDGRRVYYTLVKEPNTDAALILLGGTKHGQNRDIAQARQILVREAS